MKTKKQFNLILTDGGAGDLICQLVAVDYNIKNHPHIHFQLWLPDYLLDLARHLLKDCTIRPFSKAKSKFRQDLEGLSTQWNMNHTPMRTHPVDYGFHMLSDRHIYDMNKKNYLKIRPKEFKKYRIDLPEKYICIAGTSAEPIKAMPIETLNEISKYAKDHGYTPVYLGKEESHCGFSDFKVTSKIINADFSYGINLINKTNLIEAVQIINNAHAIIGMDSGLIHLSGCTDTHIIAGYTLVDPIHVAPIRNGSQSYKFQALEPDLDIPNRYYQTYHSGFQKGDYRKFPHWEKSVENMTFEKFKEKIDLILI